MKKIFVIIIALVAMHAYAQKTYRYPYQNPNLTPEQRAEDLCKRLTIHEKAKLMIMQGLLMADLFFVTNE